MFCNPDKSLCRQIRISSNKANSSRTRRSAFSLVELMVVIVIIGLLAGAVTISVRSYMTAAKRNTAKMEISNIANAIDMYYDVEKQGYPSQEPGLDVLLQPSKIVYREEKTPTKDAGRARKNPGNRWVFRGSWERGGRGSNPQPPA